MKLPLSRWRKDTISREGSSFFQSDPLPQSLSHRRGKNYHVILRKAKNLFSQQFLKIQPSPSIPLPSEREKLPHHPEQISNLSVRIEIPKQVRNDSSAQLSPRERVKLSLSHWRKDTISREGSSFFKSDPLPLSLSRRRGKNYHIILSNAKNLFSPQFFLKSTLSLYPSPIGEGRITSSHKANFLSNGNSLHNYFR